MRAETVRVAAPPALCAAVMPPAPEFGPLRAFRGEWGEVRRLLRESIDLDAICRAAAV